MSGFDANPFADPFASNPFADPAVTRVTNQSNMAQSGLDDYNPFTYQQKSQQTKIVGGGGVPQYNIPPIKQEAPQPAMMQPIAEPPPSYTPTAAQLAVMQPIVEPPPSYTPIAAQPLTSSELQKKQEELEKKAAELQAKEDALNRGVYDARANNWPPLPKAFCVGPCFYQDISVDIPLEFQKLVKTMYYLWMYYSCLLFVNILGCMALMFSGTGYATLFGFSIFAFVLFTPLSYVCWFRPLYKAFRSDSSFNFMVFFFIFFFQFVLSVIYAIGIPNFGSCGFIVGIGAMGVNAVSGTLALIIAALHTLFAAASFFMLLKIHRIYRNTGASFAKAQEEFTSGVLRNDHVQTAAATAVIGAARQSMNQPLSGNHY